MILKVQYQVIESFQRATLFNKKVCKRKKISKIICAIELTKLKVMDKNAITCVGKTCFRILFGHQRKIGVRHV